MTSRTAAFSLSRERSVALERFFQHFYHDLQKYTVRFPLLELVFHVNVFYAYSFLLIHFLVLYTFEDLKCRFYSTKKYSRFARCRANYFVFNWKCCSILNLHGCKILIKVSLFNSIYFLSYYILFYI